VSLTSEVSTEARFDECPGAGILRLFLRPTLFGVREALGGVVEGLEWEGSNLFDSDNSNVVVTFLLTLSLQVVVNLTTAVNDLTDLVISNKVGIGIIEHLVESETFSEVFEVGVASSELQ
jgi:hypothetical protein